MFNEERSPHDDGAEELLRRALLDESTSVAVSLTVGGLPLSDAVTVIFHGRRDLGTLQTYVACGSRGAGAISWSLRVTACRRRIWPIGAREAASAPARCPPDAGAALSRPRRASAPRRTPGPSWRGC